MIDVIFVRYYLNEKGVESKLSQLEKVYGNILNRIIVVDIGATELCMEGKLSHNIKLVRFDSDMMDISAYRKGIEVLLQSSQSYDERFILCLNDTLFLKHPGRFLLKQFKKSLWVKDIKQPFVLGVVDKTKSIHAESASLLNKEFVSTFAFLINWKSIEIFMRSYNDALKQEPDIVLSSFFDIHLSQEPNPYAWGRAMGQDIITVKRLCVFFERLFSQSVKDNHGIVIDVNASILDKLVYRILDRLL